MTFDRAQDRLMDVCVCLTQPGQFYFIARRCVVRADQAMLERTSTFRSALKSSPLIPFVHCLASRAGQVRPNFSLEPTRDITVAEAQRMYACGSARRSGERRGG